LQDLGARRHPFAADEILQVRLRAQNDTTFARRFKWVVIGYWKLPHCGSVARARHFVPLPLLAIAALQTRNAPGGRGSFASCRIRALSLKVVTQPPETAVVPATSG
jgi:hypothetical protein